ncbi:hypothetical protein F4778DRAFT_802433, partial [Xylariomycetidae sp. FL2044]
FPHSFYHQRFSFQSVSPRHTHTHTHTGKDHIHAIESSASNAPTKMGSIHEKLEAIDLCQDNIQYIINHVFLPPYLPQRNDYATRHEECLVHATLDGLRAFKQQVCVEQLPAVESAVYMINNLWKAHDFSVDHTVVNPETLLAALRQLNQRADALCRMSRQEFCGAIPVVCKAAQQHREVRDTTHPKVITELFSAFLRSLGTVVEVQDLKNITKNTREEVYYQDTFLPWHRSSLWMLVRVSLQLHFSRSAFMLYFMARIAVRSLELDVSSDMLYLAPQFNSAILEIADISMQKTHARLKERWSSIQQEHCPPLDFTGLEDMNIENDTLLRLSSMDDFINSISRRRHISSSRSFDLTHALPEYGSTNPPKLGKTSSFESWVATNLDKWMATNAADYKLTSRLKEMIMNPESSSIMVLTVLELWVALDKETIRVCGLLKQYGPGIPPGLFHNLILPSKDQMQRLYHIEMYLARRAASANYPATEVFSTTANETCFAVRYFEQIEADARRTLRKRIGELRKKKQAHEELQSEFSNQECQCSPNHASGRRSRAFCQRCQLEDEADSLRIKCFEWPLPEDDLQAKATVFELLLPRDFGHWRDTTAYVLVDFLGATYRSEKTPFTARKALEYTCLEPYFKSFNQHPRLCWRSYTKSHMDTHRYNRPYHVTEIDEDGLCLQNALRFKLYDSKSACLVGTFQMTEKLSEQCRYILPEQSSALAQFICQRENLDGPSPNSVLSTLVELATMPLGSRLPWWNILRQLAAPSIDFLKIEAVLVILQCIFRAGSNSARNVMRNAHIVLDDRVFVSIVTRVLSLSPHGTVQELCLESLSNMRDIALLWIAALKDKTEHVAVGKAKSGLRSRILCIALICSDSFNIAEPHLTHTLRRAESASTFLYCCMVISEESRFVPRVDVLHALLYRRWERLSFRCFPILRTEITRTQSSALDHAIKLLWSTYSAQSTWKPASSPYDHRLLSTFKAGKGKSQSSVQYHYSLLTGKLLVNGNPFGRLSADYQSQSQYQSLFGSIVIEVGPSSIPGLAFASKSSVFGHTVDVGLWEDNLFACLVLRASRGKEKFELIPDFLLRHRLPPAFVDGYIHWYHFATGHVELSPKETPWDHSEQNWKLVHDEKTQKWRLTKEAVSLIHMHSPSGKKLAGIFSSLGTPSHMTLTFDEDAMSIGIELSNLQLGFSLRLGETSIKSRQYQGMFIDACQTVGTLIGLRSKLVLKGPTNFVRRKVLIPNGRVSYERAAGHVRVSIDKSTSTRTHAYDVDNLLGRLTGDGSMQSQLSLSYFHALTSFCLPDPLTGMTGTEQALSILRAASVWSFSCLTQDNLDVLVNIARLTPTRSYYPESERVMQTVKWSTYLGFLSQHGYFYQHVHAILDHSQKLGIFYPDTFISPPELDYGCNDLLERDNIRSSTFRTDEFGAECRSTKDDRDYKSRDCDQNSQSSRQAFILSSLILNPDSGFQWHMSDKLEDYIWEFLCENTREEDDTGGLRVPRVLSLEWDVKWLTGSSHILAQDWLQFHSALSTAKPNMFLIMLWLSSLAFDTKADLQVLQILAYLYKAPQMAGVRLPEFQPLNLEDGCVIEEEDLQQIFRGQYRRFHFTSFSELCCLNDIFPEEGESDLQFHQRLEQLFEDTRGQNEKIIIELLKSQWPCEQPTLDESTMRTLSHYFNMVDVRSELSCLFEDMYARYNFWQYLGQLCSAMPRYYLDLQIPIVPAAAKPSSTRRRRPAHINSAHISFADIFACQAPQKTNDTMKEVELAFSGKTRRINRLPRLLEKLDGRAQSTYEKSYVKSLRGSLDALARVSAVSMGPITERKDVESPLSRHLILCKERLDMEYTSIIKAITVGLETQDKHFASRLGLGSLDQHWPRLSPQFFLRCLTRQRWNRIPKGWQRCIIHYGLSITAFQRAQRLLGTLHDARALAKELGNVGHTNCTPEDHPESLLLEIENGILIREAQEEVAYAMRSPASQKNAVMQLNMGEGKSSVIAPIVAAALADGSRLVRVLVAKPQSKQMSQMLVSKLGGLLDRRVYYMPFSRAIKIQLAETTTIQNLFRECMESGGILLAQPEHILSFKLMGIECMLTGRKKIGQALLEIQRSLQDSCRDIVDESDENFSPKFELVYTLGSQRPTEFSPDRWTCIHQVLEMIKEAASRAVREYPESLEVQSSSGHFPRIRFLRQDGQARVLTLVAQRICVNGLSGFPVARQPQSMRESIYTYLTEKVPPKEVVQRVESSEFRGFWIKNFKNLLLLRGLIAEGILAFSLGQKRWRPKTRMAVPYQGKDMPTARSEFSHPDVGIVLTSLNQAFRHLITSENADTEYQVWQLVGVNLEDRQQWLENVFPCLRYAKGAIDYFLSHILSASGWDLGEKKAQPLTGFSGTNDSRQLHTNALVLEHLLKPENSVALIRAQREPTVTDAQVLLEMVTRLQPDVRVILDVGALILELNNRQKTHAVIFFDDQDELCVLDRSGRLDRCLLPIHYRAAVTLGSGLTKDRLVQACMRMRELGNGQSIETSTVANINTEDILTWSIAETWKEMKRSMALWAMQGRRHQRHEKLWDRVVLGSEVNMSKPQAELFLEHEAQTLEARYKPPSGDKFALSKHARDKVMDPISSRCLELTDLELNTGNLHEEQEHLRELAPEIEEQQHLRELAPEIAEERHLQKPSMERPELHHFHSDVETFISCGRLVQGFDAYYPAFQALQNTSIASLYDVKQFRAGLLVTADFARTVERNELGKVLDSYQRNVQWVLTGCPNGKDKGCAKHMMVISPFEAEVAIPLVQKSHIVALHLYAPRLRQDHQVHNKLDLYTIPSCLCERSIPRPLIVELNLFAGQLYLDSFEEYKEVCNFLGLAWKKSEKDEMIAADGFILRDSKGRIGGESGLTASPAEFFKALFTTIRRNCVGINKTHMGRILDGHLMTQEDFETESEIKT